MALGRGKRASVFYFAAFARRAPAFGNTIGDAAKAEAGQKAKGKVCGGVGTNHASLGKGYAKWAQSH